MFERALVRPCASRLTRYPRWPAASRMRARASLDTLAPGVNVRDTAERDTPARSATSAAVTNEPRPRSSLIALRFLPGCAHVCSLFGFARACNTRVFKPWTAEIVITVASDG